MKKVDIDDITPVVLAGGKGTRLQPVVADRSKVVALVKGRPFVSYILDQLIEAGFEKVIFCVGYLAETLKETLGNQYRDLSITYSQENVPLGTGGAVRKATNLIETRYLLIMNGDSFLDVDLLDFIAWHFKKRFGASIVLSNAADVSRYGAVLVSDEQAIIAFAEKSGIKRAGLVNAGIYLFEKRLLEDMVGYDAVYSLEKEFFPLVVGKIKVGGYPCKAPLLDIGTPESYRMAETADFL